MTETVRHEKDVIIMKTLTAGIDNNNNNNNNAQAEQRRRVCCLSGVPHLPGMIASSSLLLFRR
jgi:hypothetical protein